MVEPIVTIVFAGLLALTLIVLATEKVHKTLVTLVAGMVALILGLAFGIVEHTVGHGGVPFYISVIDWTIIGIVIGVMIFVEIAARSGIFTWSSIRLIKLSKGDPFKLLVYLSILTVIFSALLDNITAMIIIGSLTVVACRKLGLKLFPYLMTEGILTNIGGILTLVSSLPNIILGSAAGFSYLYFVSMALPYGIVAVFVTILMARYIFKVKPLKTRQEKQENFEKVLEFDEWETVKNKPFFYTSWFILLFVVLGFAFHSYLPLYKHLGIEFIPITAGIIMLFFQRKHLEEALSKIEWTLVFFFFGLFLLIGLVEKADVLLALGGGITYVLGFGPFWGNTILMWGSAIISSVTDNIPLAAMLAKTLVPMGDPQGMLMTWWSVIFGSNLGGNLSPIGSASTVIAYTIMHKEKLSVKFFDFVKIGSMFAVVQLLLASGYVALRFLVF